MMGPLPEAGLFTSAWRPQSLPEEGHPEPVIVAGRAGAKDALGARVLLPSIQTAVSKIG
jgi:hypothetical protein